MYAESTDPDAINAKKIYEAGEREQRGMARHDSRAPLFRSGLVHSLKGRFVKQRALWARERCRCMKSLSRRTIMKLIKVTRGKSIPGVIFAARNIKQDPAGLSTSAASNSDDREKQRTAG